MASKSVQLESIIEELGPLGKYQVLVLILLNLAESPTSWSVMFMTVAGQVPGWSCNSYTNKSVHYLNNSINFSRDVDFRNIENRSFMSCEDPYTGGSCSNITYEHGAVTVASEFDLVCGRKWINSAMTTVLMCGFLVGAFFGGQLGELIGRKKTFFFNYSLVLVLNVLAVFSPTWQVFAAIRFVLGFVCGGVLVVNFPLPIEFVGKKYRTMTGAIPFWSLGVVTLALLSWLVPNWKHLSISIACLGSPLLLSWWFVPESVRWLITHGQVKEAKTTLRKIAKFNGKPEPDLTGLEATVFTEVEAEKRRGARFTFLNLFNTREYTVKTLKFTFIWFSCGVTFYGLSFGAGSLAGNVYLNVFLNGLVEAPAVASVIYFNNCAGRKKTAFTFLTISALGSLCVVVAAYTASVSDLTRIISALSLTSKLGIAGGWIAVQVFTAEHYPTVVRSLAYGFSCMAARLGSILSPQIVYLGNHVVVLPYVVYGGLMMLSAVVILTLRETHGTDLPDEFIPTPEKCKKEANPDTNGPFLRVTEP